MAKYVREEPAPVPKPKIDAMLWLAVAGLAASIGIGVMIALFPQFRALLWLILSGSVAVFFGFTAYYVLERIKSPHRRALVGAVATAVIGFCVPISAESRTDKPISIGVGGPPAERGSLLIQFYGDARHPQELNSENLYRWRAEFLEFTERAGPRPAEMVFVTGHSQKCAIFIIWKRPVLQRNISVRFSGYPTPAYQVDDVTPYSAVIAVDGIIPAGTMEIVADVRPGGD